MCDFKIVKAGNDDISYIVSLSLLYLKKQYEECCFKNERKIRKKIKNFFIKSINSGMDIFLVKVKNECVAVYCIYYLQLLPNMYKDNKIGYLIFDYALLSYRSYEFRKKIFDFLIFHLKEKGITIFEVTSTEEDLVGYEKYGFRRSIFPAIEMNIDKRLHEFALEDNSNIDFRIAEEKDIFELIEIRKKYLFKSLGKEENESKNLLFEEKLKKLLKEHLNSNIKVFLAEKSNTIIGTIFVIWYEKLPEPKYEFNKIVVPLNLYVDPNFDKKLLCKGLFCYAAKCFSNVGIRSVEMAVVDEELKFYQMMGFNKSNYIPIQKIVIENA